jgi:hypothetical protein
MPTDGTDVALTTAVPSKTYGVKLTSGKSKVTIEVDADDYGEAILVLTYEPDFEKPTIGAVTAIDCGFTIAVTDNIEVDTGRTELTVVNSDGEDVTSTLTVVSSDNGTKGTVTVTGRTGMVDTFAVTIIAYDKAGNQSDEVTKTVTVATCVVEPVCLDIDPSYLLPGDTNQEVIITGEDTAFAEGTTTVAFACEPDVTINSTAVNSVIEIVLDVSVDAAAAEGDCDVTVTTGNEEITCDFAIGSEVVEECVDADNDTSDAYDNETCPSGDDCDDTDPDVNPGATESLAEGNCDDGIDNDCDGDIDTADSGCEVVTPECELEIMPATVASGFLFPRIAVLRISSDDADFDNTEDAEFGSEDIIPMIQMRLGPMRIVIVRVRPRSDDTTSTVTMGDCEGDVRIR